jgi:hypothetical protein
MDKERKSKLWSSLSYRKGADITTASLLYLFDHTPYPALRDQEPKGWLREHGLAKHEVQDDFMTILIKLCHSLLGWKDVTG